MSGFQDRFGKRNRGIDPVPMKPNVDVAAFVARDREPIGELGIGLNPAVGEPSGYTLTDEKILGTVHLALGDNTMLGGVNDSREDAEARRIQALHPQMAQRGGAFLAVLCDI